MLTIVTAATTEGKVAGTELLWVLEAWGWVGGFSQPAQGWHCLGEMWGCCPGNLRYARGAEQCAVGWRKPAWMWAACAGPPVCFAVWVQTLLQQVSLNAIPWGKWEAISFQFDPLSWWFQTQQVIPICWFITVPSLQTPHTAANFSVRKSELTHLSREKSPRTRKCSFVLFCS